MLTTEETKKLQLRTEIKKNLEIFKKEDKTIKKLPYFGDSFPIEEFNKDGSFKASVRENWEELDNDFTNDFEDFSQFVSR